MRATLRGLVLLLALAFLPAAMAAAAVHYGTLGLDGLTDQAIYLTATPDDEIVVTSMDTVSPQGLQQRDYLTHINGVKVLSGGLADFLKNQEEEAVIPVIDDADEHPEGGGSRLIGFVKLVAVPVASRLDIRYRRGDVVYDVTETAVAGSIDGLPR